MEKYEALISVIIPAFNSREYVRRCINSILEQSYENIEVIVVNDGSTDDTLNLLTEIACADKRLHVLDLDQNVGIHAARAAGLGIANGEYIGFVDSDDWIAPQMFYSLLLAVTETNSDIAVCGVEKVSTNGKLVGKKVKFHSNKEVYKDNILEKFCMRKFGSGVLWNKLYRAELIKKYGLVKLERKIDASEDYVVNIGCFAHARSVVTLRDCYYYYYQVAGSASREHGNAKHFVRILAAYAASLRVYSYFNFEKQEMITKLFSSQLRFSDYQVKSFHDLVDYRENIKSSLLTLSEYYPEGVYSLIHSFETDKPSNRHSVKRYVKKSYNALLYWFKKVNYQVGRVR